MPRAFSMQIWAPNWPSELEKPMIFIDFSMVLWISTFFILRSFSELFKASVELSWATLNMILALKNILRGSLGAASGSLTAHTHSTDSIDCDLEPLANLLEALLVAFRCPRDLQSLQIRCPKLLRKGFPPIFSSPHLILSSETHILSSRSSFQSTSAA